MRLEAGITERRGGVTRYQSSDIKNSTAQVASSQTVVGTKQYDAFGNLTSSSGSWNGPFSYGGAFGYQTETDTGYQLLGHRYYDPTTGRFLTRDPIGDGRNWYTYCGNNPVSYCDAGGLIMQPVTGKESVGQKAGKRAREWATSKKQEYIRRWSGKGGKGHPLNTDCAWFVAQCYMGLIAGFPKEHTGNISRWLKDPKKNLGRFKRVANDGKYVPQPGDIWIIRDEATGQGHVIIVGDDGVAYDASLGDHPPEAVLEKVDPDNKKEKRKPRKNPEAGYEIWRPS